MASEKTAMADLEDLNRTLYDIGAQDLLDVWEAMETQVSIKFQHDLLSLVFTYVVTPAFKVVILFLRIEMIPFYVRSFMEHKTKTS